jgi:hypothetical protein
MSTKHTPGPWMRVPHPDKAGWIIKGATSEIGFLYLYGPSTGGPSWDEANANARILDAAPALLAALQELLPLAECYVRDNKSHGERLVTARAAIAKAVQS